MFGLCVTGDSAWKNKAGFLTPNKSEAPNIYIEQEDDPFPSLLATHHLLDNWPTQRRGHHRQDSIYSDKI